MFELRTMGKVCHTFLSVIRHIQTNGTECAQTNRRTDKTENIMSARLRSLGGHNDRNLHSAEGCVHGGEPCCEIEAEEISVCSLEALRLEGGEQGSIVEVGLRGIADKIGGDEMGDVV